MIKLKRIFSAALISIGLIAANLIVPVAAVGAADCDEGFYSDNNIIYYDPCADVCATTSATSVSVSGSDGLPASTAQYLDSIGVKAKVEANKERYLYAQSQVGVPWQVVAALHYREGGLRTESSVFNGAALGSGVNVDGQEVVADPKEDAKRAAAHFVAMAKGSYGIDVLANNSSGITTEGWGNAFLAYNRGVLYKQNGKTYDQSPYVMNGFDEQHLNMSWVGPPADPAVNGVDGNKAGALAVLIYLGGMNIESSCASSGAVTGNIVKTALNYANTTPANNGDISPDLATQAYREAMPQFNGMNAVYPQVTDCGRFVSTVMHASQADVDMPQVTVSALTDHMDTSGKYEALGAIAFSELRPGDIIAVEGQHILIFTGPNGDYVAADASYEDRIPSVRYTSGVDWMLGAGGKVWRLK